MTHVLIRNAATPLGITGICSAMSGVGHVELSIQTFHEHPSYTRHCYINYRDTMRKTQCLDLTALWEASQHVHNCMMWGDSATMYRKCVQEAVGIQKSEGGH